MPKKPHPKKSGKSALLGVGLDGKDGHVRVTTGPNFKLVGGSAETHGVMQEKAIKVNEHLKKRGKTLETVRIVTELAIEGIADAVGDWAGIVWSLFILAAFVTSYWSVSLALADIIRERTAIHHNLAWLLATLPSLVLVLIGIGSFLPWLRLAAGAVGIVIALITIPMYVNARRVGSVTAPDWSLGRWGSPAMLALALLAMVLMALGSLIET